MKPRSLGAVSASYRKAVLGHLEDRIGLVADMDDTGRRLCAGAVFFWAAANFSCGRRSGRKLQLGSDLSGFQLCRAGAWSDSVNE